MTSSLDPSASATDQFKGRIVTFLRIRTATLKVLMARAETLPVSMLRKILIKVLAYRSEPLAVASSRRVTLKLLDERQEGMGL